MEINPQQRKKSANWNQHYKIQPQENNLETQTITQENTNNKNRKKKEQKFKTPTQKMTQKTRPWQIIQYHYFK